MRPYRSIRSFRTVLGLIMLLVSAFSLQAQNPSVDFKQASNKNPGLGEIYWINSIVQQNNSIYYEGMAVPQRIIFRNLAPGTHKLVLSHQSIKQSNGTHAYDFLTSWDQAIDAAAQMYPASPLLAGLRAAQCGDALPGSFTTECSGRTYNTRVDIVAPNANPNPTFGSGSVASKKTAFDSYFASDDRMQIWGNATISNASLTFLGYFGNDQDARYELTWTSTADNAIIEFAGHLASGNDFFGGTNIGWGIGKGCGAIAGAPYHINLKDLTSNGNLYSLGNQDNQVKGIDIRSCADLSAIATNVSCYGGSNGVINLTVNGGVAPYTFLWSNGATTEDLSGLTAGSYSVSVTDNTGCISRTSVEITEPAAALVASIGTPTHVSCFGLSNGSATASAVGGTGAYSYSWNTTPIQTTANATGLSQGTYTVTITDANGCFDTKTITITQPIQVTLTASGTNVSCYGLADGTITASASAGATITVNGNAYDANATYGPGDYTVVATAPNGNADGYCTDTKTITITQPIQVTLTASGTNVSCFGLADGTITASASAGATITVNGNAYDANATYGPGDYTVVATAPNGNTDGYCTDTKTITITQPIQVTLTASGTNVSCFGLADGTITASASAGATITVNGNAYDANATYGPGDYTVVATAPNGNTDGYCTDTKTITITQPIQVTLTASGTNVSCFGLADGTITASASAGATITVNGNAYDANATYGPGDYTVVATAPNGNADGYCTDTKTITITQPIQVTLTASGTNVSCFGLADGTITASASAGATITVNGNAYDANATYGPGDYTVVATAPNGNTDGYCTDTKTITITQPIQVTLTASGTNVSCFGLADGTITASASAGATITVNGNAYDANATYGPGDYTVVATAPNGNADGYCTDTKTITITQPEVLVASIGTPTPVKCFGGSDGSATASGGGGTAPYSYSWDNGQTIAAATGLSQGMYTVTITDANGCIDTETVTINQPDLLTLSISSTTNITCKGESTGSISVSATGGNSGLTYSINGTSFQSAAVFNNLKAGSYTITVKDSKGCTATADATLTEGPVCYPYYTFSQGYYGNAGGKACIREQGLQTTNAFMLAALSNNNGNPMILGNPAGVKRLTVNALPADVTKLIGILPATTTAAVLGNGPFTVYNIPTKNNKITNVLVGQTTAMWLNVHIPGNKLGELDLIDADGKNYIVTRAVNSSSTCTEPFRAACSSNSGSLTSTLFPQAVINALKARKAANPSKGTTVNDLVDFASEALGGLPLYGTNLTTINNALDMVINAFHSGRYFEQFSATAVTCSTTTAPASFTRGGEQPVETTDAVKPEMPKDIMVQSYPSPFIDQLNFRILSPVSGSAKLEVYNTMGQLLRTVFQGNVTAGIPVMTAFETNRPEDGMLIYKLTIGKRTIVGKAIGVRSL